MSVLHAAPLSYPAFGKTSTTTIPAPFAGRPPSSTLLHGHSRNSSYSLSPSPALGVTAPVESRQSATPSPHPSSHGTSTTPLSASMTASQTALRRPSAVASLQSFLEGVEFATRFSSTIRRGESRSLSRQPTSSGAERDADRKFLPTGIHYSPARDARRHKTTLAEEEEAFLSDAEDSADEEEAIRHHLASSGSLAASVESVQVFEDGDRIGVNGLHAGEPILECFEDRPSQVKQLEIVRKLGSGSYAVVYLAREIVRNTQDDDSSDEDNVFDSGHETVYGQEFALKCLSKRNLTDDLLEVQKFEATLHQALPAHPNIVSMHGAWETTSWLFLLLEYCPGQDLFYWLEQAKDHETVDSLMHPSASFMTARAQQKKLAENFAPESHSATPPSPTLLSITAMSSLLSRRRLRLVSRMFMQMCDAVAATHRVGISHRDIKPENFIACDEHGSSAGSDRRVIVKLTDFGLGTSEIECGDFDCGSKPYMAYECRNNLGPSYRPREADIWSLGIVLINMLFHRCPWADPTLEDPDFSEYLVNPVAFLEDRFHGIGREVSLFLAHRVLNCDGPRVSAAEFGEWSAGLVRSMCDPITSQPLVSTSAVPMVSTRPSDMLEMRRLSHIISQVNSARPSPRASLLVSQIHLSDPPIASPLSADDVPQDLRFAVEEHVSRELTYGGEDAGRVTEEIDSETAALAAKAKRRKRGARKGRHGQSAQSKPNSPAGSVYSSPNAPFNNASEELASYSHSRDAGRKQPSLSLSPPRSNGRPPLPQGKSTGFMDKFKGALRNGNPDLEAFVQQARAREAQRSGETYSAPAMMQNEKFGVNSGASFNSAATRSTSSSWSVETDSRGHWASTSNRRERVGRHREGSDRHHAANAVSPTRLSSVSSYDDDMSPSSLSRFSPLRSASSVTYSSASSVLSEKSPDVPGASAKLMPPIQEVVHEFQKMVRVNAKQSSTPASPEKSTGKFNFKGLFK